jgi:hypothetical protein
MIYANLPLNCRFIPIDVNDEVFQIIFMLYFRSYLKNAAQIFMRVVDGDTDTNFDEGDIIYAAQWAKDIYKNYEKNEETCEEIKKQWLKCKRKAYIANNVAPEQLGFDFHEVSCSNVNKSITLYNAILKKI